MDKAHSDLLDVISETAAMMKPEKSTNYGDVCKAMITLAYYRGSDDDRKRMDNEFYDIVRNHAHSDSAFHNVMRLGLRHVPEVEKWPDDLLGMAGEDFNGLLAVLHVYEGTGSFEKHYRKTPIIKQNKYQDEYTSKLGSAKPMRMNDGEWMATFYSSGKDAMFAVMSEEQTTAETRMLGIYFIVCHYREIMYKYLHNLMRIDDFVDLLPVSKWPAHILENVPEDDINRILLAMNAWFEIMALRKEHLS